MELKVGRGKTEFIRESLLVAYLYGYPPHELRRAASQPCMRLRQRIIGIPRTPHTPLLEQHLLHMTDVQILDTVGMPRQSAIVGIQPNASILSVQM